MKPNKPKKPWKGGKNAGTKPAAESKPAAGSKATVKHD